MFVKVDHFFNSIGKYNFFLIYQGLERYVELKFSKEKSEDNSMAHEENIPVQMNILKAIFSDHWSRFLKENKGKMRPVIIEEVEKFLHCGELSNDFLTFKCEACPKVKKIPIRCKGKFCPTCAAKMDGCTSE